MRRSSAAHDCTASILLRGGTEPALELPNSLLDALESLLSHPSFPLAGAAELDRPLAAAIKGYHTHRRQKSSDRVGWLHGLT
jgi:hypothetical protein